jgi:hypothetical protein
MTDEEYDDYRDIKHRCEFQAAEDAAVFLELVEKHRSLCTLIKEGYDPFEDESLRAKDHVKLTAAHESATYWLQENDDYGLPF